MPNQVVWIVIAIILALVVFFIGSGMVGTSKIEFGNILKLFNWQRQELAGIKGMEDACKAWLGGAEKYSSRSILEKYLVTDKSAPYGVTLDCCSVTLRAAATENIQACAADPTSCNGGNLDPASYEFQGCWRACQAVLQMADSCRNQCYGASEAQLAACVNNGIASGAPCSGTTGAISCT